MATGDREVGTTRGYAAHAPRWIYVAGDGRSGSTVLGSLLAASLDAFDCGELHLLWQSLVDGRLCTCGDEAAHCTVWSKVATVVRDELHLHDDEAVVEIARRRLRQRQLLSPRMPEPLSAELALRRATEAAIEQVTGANTLVDSSKLSSVLWTAAHIGRPLTVAHLVRDPRAVAFSWARPRRDPSLRGAPMEHKSVWRSSTDWLRAHLTIERVLSRVDCTSVRIRYEDLVEDPAAAVFSVVGVQLEDVVAFTDDADGQRHAIAGNPARFRHGQPIKRDDRWRRDLSLRDRMAVTTLTAPLLHHFGYGLRSS